MHLCGLRSKGREERRVKWRQESARRGAKQLEPGVKRSGTPGFAEEMKEPLKGVAEAAPSTSLFRRPFVRGSPGFDDTRSFAARPQSLRASVAGRALHSGL